MPTKSDVPLHDGLKKKAVRHTLSDRQGNRVDLLSQRTGGRKQGVRIASGNDKLTINLDRTKTEITVDSKGAVKITGSRSVSVDAGTDLSLSARRALTIKSGGPLSIQSSMINMRSGGVIGVTAGGALNLGAAGAATLSAGAADDHLRHRQRPDQLRHDEDHRRVPRGQDPHLQGRDHPRAGPVTKRFRGRQVAL
ncbi:hypothetical protein SVIOM342S_06868 [Streptomyces violaceorubidus]